MDAESEIGPGTDLAASASTVSSPAPPKLNQLDLAYWAGLFDGEGWISIIKSVYSKSPCLEIGMSMVDGSPVEFYNYFGVGGITRPRPREHWQQQTRYRAHGKNAQAVLSLLLPYVRLKRKRAELAIEFQGLQTGRGLTDPHRAEEIRHAIRSQNFSKGSHRHPL